MIAPTLVTLLDSAELSPAGSALPGEHSGARIRFGEVQLDTGVRLRYAEQGGTTGKPVILLHGISDSWFSFSRVLPLLPAEYHVFALDLRGHGESEKPAAGYAMRDLAADVISFMTVKGLHGVTVAGHSMGSFVAQQVALHAPERLERLVLMGSTTTPRKIDGIRELQEAVQALGDPVPVSFVREFQLSTIHHAITPEFLETAITESLRLPARVWQSSVDGMLATERAEGLEGNPVPTLILWGDHDTMFLRAEQDALLAMLPNSVLKVYADTGHALHWERPAEFARDLEAFITE